MIGSVTGLPVTGSSVTGSRAAVLIDGVPSSALQAVRRVGASER